MASIGFKTRKDITLLFRVVSIRITEKIHTVFGLTNSTPLCSFTLFPKQHTFHVENVPFGDL